jgi:hypothetical protein
MSKADQERNGAKLQAYIDSFAGIGDLHELRLQEAEAGGYLSGMTEFGGCPAMVAEAWAARIKKAAAQRRRAIHAAEREAGIPGTSGLRLHMLANQGE